MRIDRIITFLTICVCCVFLPDAMCAQETDIQPSDTLLMPAMTDSLPTITAAEMFAPVKSDFVPNPTRAVIYSAIFPGLGQIYNRKYWKLPIVYGGIMGVIYAINWNNKTYKGYSDALKYVRIDREITEETQWHSQYWKPYVPYGMDAASYLKDASFESTLKRGRDYNRRNRDLSIIIMVGVYFIAMVDAYVDAQLFDFDISPDLSMQVVPVITQPTGYSSATIGLSWNITF